jgi:hypothetical protein
MTKIGEMIRSIEELTFVSDLDLNMGHYYIKLDSDTQNICRISFPWKWGDTNTNAYPCVSKLPLIFFKNHASDCLRYGIC